jgi:hypothetical protein
MIKLLIYYFNLSLNSGRNSVCWKDCSLGAKRARGYLLSVRAKYYRRQTKEKAHRKVFGFSKYYWG